MSSEELRLFDKVRVFLDEDYTSAEHFTVSSCIIIVPFAFISFSAFMFHEQ